MTENANPLDALKDAKSSADLHAPSVIISEGDYLTGTVVRFSTGFSDQKNDAGEQQGEYPIVVLNVGNATLADKDSQKIGVEGEDVSIHVFHRVLKSQMLKANVSPGDLIGIRRFPDVKARDGKRTYADYGVVQAEGAASGGSFADRFSD